MFNKILIANRGEIALRIMRAAHELGVQAVAVYSEADRLAPHVLAADEAYPIGPAPSAQSYLRMEALIEVAKRSGAEAVHPGYGFLSERAPFIRAVREAGLVFIGPPAEAVEAMGDKTAARRRMTAAGVPVVPGTQEPLRDAAEARRVAEEVGYPVLLKAAAGGGGKGMRVVREAGEIERALAAAGNEARAAFGDDAVYVEKYLERPAAHRDPGAGGPARQRGAPGRAGVLDPAAAPEDDRGGALGGADARAARARWARRRWRRPGRWATRARGRWSSSTRTGSSSSWR